MTTDLWEQEAVTARIEGADTVVGTVYRIVAQGTLDFTTVGAPDNVVDTVFIADAVDTLGSGDALSEITAPPKKIPSKDPWPALAGTEAITLQNNRDFSSGTIGNWSKGADGTGTLAFDNTDIGGNTSHAKILLAGDESYFQAQLFSVASWPVTTGMHRFELKTWIPSGNTTKGIRIELYGFDINQKIDFTPTVDTWDIISGYFYIDSDVDGRLMVKPNGALIAGDIYYFDDISIRPIGVDWARKGENTLEIDETANAIKVTGIGTTQYPAARIYLRSSDDIIKDLVIGQKYVAELEAKVGTGDSINISVINPPITQIVTVTSTSFVTVRIFFIASSTTGNQLQLGVGGSFVAGEELWIRNVSLRPYGGSKSGRSMGMGLSLK